MVFHDVVTRGAVRPLDRRRGVGGRLLPAREPGAQDGALRLADRLRRRAADARGGEREAFLAADHNAQMVEHVARHPRLRDRSIFIGDPDDIVAEPPRPGPARRSATGRGSTSVRRLRHGFDPAEIADRDALRAEFGYGPDEQVCVVAAGGSAVGRATCCARAAAAFPEAKRRVPELRMILSPARASTRRSCRAPTASRPTATSTGSTGSSRPATSRSATAASSTTMELTAAGRPFLYFPLRAHFEQNRHVAHRLDRHGAGRRMDSTPTARGDRGRDRRGARAGAALRAGSARRRRARGADDRRAAVAATATRQRPAMVAAIRRASMPSSRRLPLIGFV